MAHPPSYSIPNLTILSESTTRVLDIGGLKLRLLGLGGAVISHKLFDNGEGPGTTAGAAGTMWTTILQIGELVDTAQRVYSQSETRLFISHASPGKEGLLAQLALVLRADFTVSASLHFRYGTSYNEFSVQQDQDAFRRKLLQSKDAFNEVWGRVRADVEAQIDDEQKPLLENALAVTNRVPQEPVPPGSASPDDFAYKNVWHFNLPDTTYGNLIFDLADGRVSTEMKSQGFHYLYRQNPPAPSTARPSLPSKGPSGPSPQATRAPSLAPSNEPSRSPAHRPQQHRDDHPHGRANGFNRNDRFSGNWNNSHSSNNERGPYNQPSGPMHRVGPKPADAPIKPPAVGPVATDSAAQRENSERPGSATGGRKTPNSNKPGKRPQGDRPERAQSEKPPASDVPAAATPTGETVPESSRPSRGGGRGHSRGGSAGGSRGGPTRGRGGNRPNEPREPREPRPPRENKPDAAKPQPGAASAPKAEAGDAKAASAKPAADANGA
ncbi:uncharacterized protein L969DRAFT_85853 [Mixia osmundae IAM 14324]|nr:uncharacterized protein L969DRAFT_85853 [Mixia osmundae IAM 14324]KEI40639.1 hypothetical protein L969DRAFT_85853 [Mixia osmundae IAM 14324]